MVYGTESHPKSAHHYNAETYSQVDTPRDCIVRFLYITLADLGWYQGAGEDVLMDLGCGPGRVTAEYILPRFSSLKKIVALDALPAMIEQAKSLHPHPKIEYSVADFENSSVIESWKGEVTKFISLQCFNRMKDQRAAFKRVYDLLPPEGEAAFSFLLHNGYYNAVSKIAKDPKWKSYVTFNIDECVPESHVKRYSSLHYKKMMADIGFKVLHCQQVQSITTYTNEQPYMDFLFSICELSACIPESELEDFKKDLFDYTIKENGRNADLTAVDNTTMLELVVKK